ncbi:MAG: SDR family oxidoreductase [Rhizobiaceae bacterium]|nr:MAG: SDR family oxidoreductase [Rhizobiaceae bacterium]
MLKGRTILLTGAARGLGAEIARSLASYGARLILADIAEEEGRKTAAALEAGFFPVDLGDPESVAALGKAVKERSGGRLHGLVNNGAIATGIGGIGFEDMAIDSWDLVMRVNVRGTWLMTKAVAPLLRASGSGRVVNIASDTALWGAPRLLSYVASKGAVMAMTRSLAREFGPDRIGVTAVAPGILTTQSTDYVPEARHRLYAEGRAVPGPQAPGEITDVVAFLLSEGALTLTGQVLPVNNGFVFN